MLKRFLSRLTGGEMLEPRWTMDCHGWNSEPEEFETPEQEAPAEEAPESAAAENSPRNILRRRLARRFWRWRLTPETPPTPSTPPPTLPAPTVSEPSAAPAEPLEEAAYYGGRVDWNVNAINAPDAWRAGVDGDGVVVAVIDTGVNLNHSELAAAAWSNSGEIAGNGIDDDGNGYIDDTHGWDFVHRDNDPQDVNGHGTHVAATIAAARDGVGATGVAYGSQIMALQALDDNGYGDSRDLAEAIRYAVDNGADIVNLSLGGGYSRDIEAAIRYAGANDVLIVAASGNSGANSPAHPASFSADYDHVISVGAHTQSNDAAGFSNQVGFSRAVQVDAPGAGIYSATPTGYAYYNGTSMASPHAAGVAALALSADPDLDASQLRTLLVVGADRTIDDSDSQGGVNAATTVGLALAAAEREDWAAAVDEALAAWG